MYSHQKVKLADELIQLEQLALKLRHAGKAVEAVDYFKQLLERQPDWEHGDGWYNLAMCYEELGNTADAEACYRRALTYDPKNAIFLGGFASFLYLHGDVDAAIRAYVELLEIERGNGNNAAVEDIVTAVKALAAKKRMPAVELGKLLA